MDGRITIRYLQDYLMAKDTIPERKKDYCLKLMEEVGELAEAIRKSPPAATEERFKGTVEEELWDVIYYVLVLANCYGIDLEHWIPIKENYNNIRYSTGISFELDR